LAGQHHARLHQLLVVAAHGGQDHFVGESPRLGGLVGLTGRTGGPDIDSSSIVDWSSDCSGGGRFRPRPFDQVMEGHVKYMLMICRDEPVWEKMSAGERQQLYLDTVTLAEELTARGQYLGGHPLH